MTNGAGLPLFSRRIELVGHLNWMIEQSLMPFFGSFVVVPLGGTHLNVMVPGKHSIVAFVLGLLRVYLSDYSKNLVTLLIWKI